MQTRFDSRLNQAWWTLRIGLGLAAFLAGGQVLCCEPDGRLRTEGPRPVLLLSGSFNPLHAGHCDLAERLIEQSCNTIEERLEVSGRFAYPFAWRSLMDAHRGRLDRACST